MPLRSLAGDTTCVVPWQVVELIVSVSGALEALKEMGWVQVSNSWLGVLGARRTACSCKRHNL